MIATSPTTPTIHYVTSSMSGIYWTDTTWGVVVYGINFPWYLALSIWLALLIGCLFIYKKYL